MSEFTYDPDGVLAANRIVNEQHVVSPTSSSQDAGFFILDKAPFFSNSLVITNSDGDELEMGVDYYLGHEYVTANLALNRKLYGSVIIVDRSYAGNLFCDYNTLGGDFVNADVRLLEDITRQNYNILTVVWEQLAYVPNAFPPIVHTQPPQTLISLDEVVAELGGISQAIKDKPIPNPLTLLVAQIEEHLNDSNSQKHTKKQVGLDKVVNYPIATSFEALSRRSDRYLTPDNVNIIISDYLTSNPQGSDGLFKVDFTTDSIDDIIEADELIHQIYTPNNLPGDLSVFLLRGIETEPETVFNPANQTSTQVPVENDIYLCFQTFGVDASGDGVFTAEPDVRYLTAIGLNNKKTWSLTIGSEFETNDDGEWTKLSRAYDVGLDKLLNISYINHTNWSQLYGNPPEDPDVFDDSLERYVTLSAIQELVKYIKDVITPKPSTNANATNLADTGSYITPNVLGNQISNKLVVTGPLGTRLLFDNASGPGTYPNQMYAGMGVFEMRLLTVSEKTTWINKIGTLTQTEKDYYSSEDLILLYTNRMAGSLRVTVTTSSNGNALLAYGANGNTDLTNSAYQNSNIDTTIYFNLPLYMLIPTGTDLGITKIYLNEGIKVNAPLSKYTITN